MLESALFLYSHFYSFLLAPKTQSFRSSGNFQRNKRCQITFSNKYFTNERNTCVEILLLCLPGVFTLRPPGVVAGRRGIKGKDENFPSPLSLSLFLSFTLSLSSTTERRGDKMRYSPGLPVFAATHYIIAGTYLLLRQRSHVLQTTSRWNSGFGTMISVSEKSKINLIKKIYRLACFDPLHRKKHGLIRPALDHCASQNFLQWCSHCTMADNESR